MNIAKHRLKHLSPNTEPMHSASYCSGPKTREFEKPILYKTLPKNIIKLARTERAVLMLCIPRKDGALQFCDDICKLTVGTKRGSFLIPLVNKCTDLLNNANVLSILDTSCKYWPVKIELNRTDKTTVTSHHELYRFTRMPFKLRSAPATF